MDPPILRHPPVQEERVYHPEVDDEVWEVLLDNLIDGVKGGDPDSRISPQYRDQARRIVWDWLEIARYLQWRRKTPSTEPRYYSREVDNLVWEAVQEAFFEAINGKGSGELPPGFMWKIKRIASDWLTIARHLQQEKDRSVSSPVINTPGKFEGEPDYAPYFWEKTLDGGVPDEDGIYTCMVTVEDVQQFPELQVGQRILLCESDDGFVHTRLVSPVE